MNSLMRQARVLSLIGLHLRNEVDEVSRLGEEFELLGINKIVELIFNLNHQLDDIKTIETMVRQLRIKSHRSLLSSSEIALAHVENIRFNLVAGAESKGVAAVPRLPEGNLFLSVDLGRDEIA